MLVDRHRIRQLITLSALERTLQGPERLLREEDVAILIKGAYDDATASARAAFMERVKKYPESAWPWSAVASMTPRGGGGGGGGLVIVAVPSGPKSPAVLTLLMGQADSPDADPANRLPPRGSPEGDEWEPLYKALESWDTATIEKYLGPGGWRTPGGTSAGQGAGDNPGTSGAPQDGGNVGPSGSGGGNGDSRPSGNGGPPATQAMAVPRWVWGLAIAGGTVLMVGTGVALYRRGSRPAARSLEDELRRQGGAP
ncbi:MAG: hypothetical protein R3B09_35710 [Nannocystaceae bacterium]